MRATVLASAIGLIVCLAASAQAADVESWCLTGNAPDTLAARNRRVDGRYTYCDGLTTSFFFPNWQFDGKRSTGWVPFREGMLTDGKSNAYILYARYWIGRNGISLIVDLGKDHRVDKVEVEGRSGGLGAGLLFVRRESQAQYVLVKAPWDPYSGDPEPTGQQGAKSVAFEDVNSVARYLYVWLAGGRGYSLIELRVWGGPAPADPLPAKFLVLGQCRVDNPQERPVVLPADAVALPYPQEVRLRDEPFALTDRVRMTFADGSERTRQTAEVLRDELALETGVKLADPQQADGPAPGVIHLALAGDAPVTVAEGVQVSRQSPGPEGYGLAVTGRGVSLVGSDDAGLFYATQTLLHLLRQDKDGWAIRGTAIRDWPRTRLRMVAGRLPVTPGLIRLLARVKVNYYQIYSLDRAEADARHVDMARRYFVRLMLPAEPRMVIGECPDCAETNSGEDLAAIKERSRVNFCPSNPETWKRYFAALDRWIDVFNSDYISINFDEMYQTAHGARWNVCPRCRRRDMSGRQMLAWTLNRLADHARRHNRKLYMLDTCFFGPSISFSGDKDKDWRKALDDIPKDILMGVWHPKEVNDLLREKGFPQLRWRNRAHDAEYPGENYVGMVVNMVDGPFHYEVLLGLAQVTWSPERARPADEVGMLLVDRMLPVMRGMLTDRKSAVAAAGAEQHFCVDLRSAANRSFADDEQGRGCVGLGPNMDLSAMKPGRRVLGGLPYEILDGPANGGRAFVLVENRSYFNRSLPSRVEVPVERNASALVFLNALAHYPGQSYLRRYEMAGYAFMVYEDNTYSKLEFKCGISTNCWLGGGSEAVRDGRIVWKGETRGGRVVGLYATEWVNPRPDLRIRSVILQAGWKDSPCNLMVVAITGVQPPAQAVQAAGPLGDARRLALPEPRGRPLDLSGGREECEWKYVAPDGTVIETTAPFREKAYHAACHDPYYTAACATGDGNVFFRPNTADEARMDLVFPKPLRLAGLMLRAGPRVERKHMDFSDATTYFDLYVWPAAEDEIDLDEQNRREEVSTSANWVKVKAGLALSEEWGHQFLDLPNPRVKGVRLGAIRGNGISLVRPYLAAGGKAPPAAAGKEGR